MNWIYKAIVQKSISFLPFSYRMNYLFQRYFSIGRNLPDSLVIDRVNHAVKHLQSFEKWGNISIEKAKIFELGTGWYPIVPIVCFLSGSDDIETADIRKLYCRQSIDQTLRALIKLYDNASIFQLIPGFQEYRIGSLLKALAEKRASTKLQLLKITTTQCKRNCYAIESNSKDLLISNNTFQFIHRDDLMKTFHEMIRISNHNSVISIAIDFTDEFSHSDKSISNFNFLRFSEKEWHCLTNRLNSTNRLRYSDYKRLISIYFQVVYDELIRGEPEELSKINVHRMFSQYSLNDLLVKQAYLVCVNNKIS